MIFSAMLLLSDNKKYSLKNQFQKKELEFHLQTFAAIDLAAIQPLVHAC